MTEYGAQAIVSPRVWDQANAEELIEQTWERLTRSLVQAGAQEWTIKRLEPYLNHFPPYHRREDEDGATLACHWLDFEQAHPGADNDEYPECGNDEHWDPGYDGWILNAWGEEPEEDQNG